MTKTVATKEAEQFLYDYFVKDKIGVYGCHEVTIGVKPLKKGREIVDYLTYDTKNIFRAYEIKVSKEDLKSRSTLSFVGHYNYIVLPRELYNEVQHTDLEPLLKSGNVGVVIIGEGVIKKSGRKTLAMSDNIELLESMMRSLHREKDKLQKYKG
ncbi:TPA: hypothetical protein PC496_000760 [Clostridioides difficile]|nr:hypothetical protein [Clostridioides difficile]